MEISQLNAAGITARSLVHVGASTGQEIDEYIAYGIERCYYIEPIPDVFEKLSENVARHNGHVAINAICAGKPGQKITLNVSNNLDSSSIFGLGRHAKLYPEIVYDRRIEMTSTTVDALVEDGTIRGPIDALVIDTQGADLKVLRGAENTLQTVKAIIVEVSHQPLYQGGCTFMEISQFLNRRNFQLMSFICHLEGWGNALFVKSPSAVALLPTYGGNIALNKPAEQSSLSAWSASEGAQGLVNGRKTGRFGIHTSKEVRPWWQVDLQSLHKINEIRIFNRCDAQSVRASKLKVFIATKPNEWILVWDQNGRNFGGIHGGWPLQIGMNEVEAQYIRLEIDDDTFLHLDELEVY